MPNRRNFLKPSLLGASASMLAWGGRLGAAPARRGTKAAAARVVSTWDFGIAANQAAWGILGKGGNALDAVEAGVQIPESDLKNHSVGKGGYPDRDGHVTLDACILDADGSCGAGAALEHI
jgi:N4-(beta-N-acetylglucosaminyl)-L-asparaginase